MPLKIQHDEQLSLDLTPMIDVVFLLIIFFMVATSFSEQERDIELELAEVASTTAMTAAPKQRVVSVQAEGQIRLDGEDVTLAELTQRLSAARSEYPELSVVIRNDAACAFQHFAASLAACKEAQISNIGVTVRIAKSPGTTKR
ncbi:MAG: biopolymer transporter ExbD [Planctomycetes bacterium]|nr:biopolymer transporter ExbD [Planctomycetota bacterium]